MDSLISFVLPAYKADFLSEAIHSILNQTYTNFELIIVNDASPQNLKTIVDSFSDTRIQYFENPKNIGKIDLVQNWNNCLKRAHGEYVILASDDDVYHPTYLQTMVDLIKKYPNVDLFHCRLRYIDAQKHFLFYSQAASEYETVWDFIYNRIFYGRKQTAPEFMFRRAAIEPIGGFINFPIAWYSDDATWNYLAQNGVAYSSKALLDFRMSGLNLSTSSLNGLQKIQAMKLYVKWLRSYLLSLVADTEEDKKLKEHVLSNYQSLIYSHYYLYLPYIKWKYFIKELYLIYMNSIFSFQSCFKLLVNKIFYK